MDGLSLTELLSRVRKGIASSFPGRYWIRAEIRSVSEKPGSHCYFDLADKNEAGMVSAQARGIIWASSWKILKPYFIKETGNVPEAGMNILFHAQVQFTEVYGLSLIIDDLDPSYTVGELELKRLRTIERLKSEGMMEMNSTLELPRLPRRFAVISASGAAGWGDFRRHLEENEFGFRFSIVLYEAPMQGADAPAGIIDAMDRIIRDVESGSFFDAVLLMRGGGSVGDLSCFDDYDLCANIAQYPLPVMTAVGHDRDYHVCDMVSCVSVKTPTALADYILEIYMSEDEMISSLSGRLLAAVKGKISAALSGLELYRQRVMSSVASRFLKERNRLDLIEVTVRKNDPSELFRSGYSMVRRHGVTISSVADAGKDSDIEVILKDGILKCRVEDVEKFS